MGGREGVVVLLQCWENKSGTSSSASEPALGGLRSAREPSPGDRRGEARQGLTDFFPSQFQSWLAPAFPHLPPLVQTQSKSITIY